MANNAHGTIKETDGRFACTSCGYQWGAGMDDSEIPNFCSCQEARAVAPRGWAEFSPMWQQWRSLTPDGALAYHATADAAERHLSALPPPRNRPSSRP